MDFAACATTHLTVPFNADALQVRLNLGAIINLSKQHHVLLSEGPSFAPDTGMQAYFAYQLTIRHEGRVRRAARWCELSRFAEAIRSRQPDG